MDSVENIIEIKDVCFKYDEDFVLKDINLSIPKNDFIAVVGPNGGGKTTLLQLILGFHKPNKGKVEIYKNRPEKMRNKIGYVPQNLDYDRKFPINSIDVVLTGLVTSGSLFPWFSSKDRDKAMKALKMAEVEDLYDKRFSNLSGGQKQRVLIARALVDKPEILVLDEPTASVDVSVEKDIYDLLSELNKEITIILVSHDIAFVTKFVKRIACLNKCIAVHDVKDVAKDVVFDLYDSSVKMINHHCKL